jgi:uncharacterized repeat protein (TIGR01451 family)
MSRHFLRAAAAVAAVVSCLSVMPPVHAGGAQADVAASITDSRTTVLPGATSTYAIRVVNFGPAAANGVGVDDTFPANCLPTTWTCTGLGGGVCPASGSGNVAATVDLPVGGQVSFLARCTVPPDALPGTVTNTVTTRPAPGMTDPNPSNDTATDTTDVLAVARLSATKTVSGTLQPGGAITYTVVLSNGGAGAQGDNPGDEFGDTLSPALQLVSAAASGGTTTANPASGEVTWNGAIAPGASVTITIQATIRPASVGQVSNQGFVLYDSDANGTNNLPLLTDDPSTPAPNDATVFTISIPTAISLAKTVTGDFNQGGTVFYYLTMTNAGNAQADNPGDEIVDQLPAGLSLVSAAAGTGTVTTDAATRTVRWNGAVPYHGSAYVAIIAHVDETSTGTLSNQGVGHFDGDGDGVNETTVLSDDPALPGAADPTAFEVIVPPTTLRAFLTTPGASYYPNAVVPYSLSVYNYGGHDQNDNPGDEIVDTLPPQLIWVDTYATSGTATFDAATNSVHWNGAIPAHGSVSLTIFARVAPTAAGSILNQAVLHYDADSNGSNETTLLSDNGATLTPLDPTGIFVIAPVPATDGRALALLSLGLLLLALRGLRRHRRV